MQIIFIRRIVVINIAIPYTAAGAVNVVTLVLWSIFASPVYFFFYVYIYVALVTYCLEFLQEKKRTNSHC